MVTTRQLLEADDPATLTADLDLDGSNLNRAFLLSRAVDLSDHDADAFDEVMYHTLAIFHSLEMLQFFLKEYSFTDREKSSLWVDEVEVGDYDEVISHFPLRDFLRLYTGQ